MATESLNAPFHDADPNHKLLAQWRDYKLASIDQPTIREQVVATFRGLGHTRIDPWCLASALWIAQGRHPAMHPDRHDLNELAEFVGNVVRRNNQSSEKLNAPAR